MIIKGNVILKCPKSGEEVRLYRDCIRAGTAETPCPHYKHFGIEGRQIVIACTYPESEKK